MNVGLGCMRVTDGAPIAAAIDAGVVWLDTARAYDGNEALIAAVLATRAPEERARVRVITKVGMTRPDGGWQPDGRARTILEQARASCQALGRVPDLLLLHAPDPRVPLATSVRALEKAQREGLAHAIGLSNPTRRDLDELSVGIGGIEVALGPKHDMPARAGMLAWAAARGVRVFAHTPLGGVDHDVARDTVLGGVARRHRATAAEIMLAYLVALGVVPLPGARRVETARSAMAAAAIALTADDLAALDARFPGLGAARAPTPAPDPATAKAEVVIVMGVPGAGKSRLVERRYEGWERLNRDTLGGTLAGIAKRLEARLAAGATKLVLDNTYLSRATRSDVVRIAHRAGAIVRCVFIDVSPSDARINVTMRMLERHGLPGGAELQAIARRDPNVMLPIAHARLVRDIERPASDEGFASIEVVPFVRDEAAGAPGAAIAFDADPALVPPDVPLFVLGGSVDEAVLRARFPNRIVEVAACPHGDGPPVCWCRPPAPGLWLAFARKHGVSARLSTFVATTAAHRTMATELGFGTIVTENR